MSERATARATSTTETPAALTARMKGISSTTSPASEIATMSAENTMVRPARSMVVATASTTCSRVASATGAPSEEGAHLLAEAAHDEQAVVDAQAEAEHGDDVDDGGVEVEDVGERQQRHERARDRRDRAEHREPGGEEAAEHDDHDEEAHRQRDALAALAVGLDLLDDPVDEGAQAAALRAGGAGLLREPVEDGVHLRGRGVLLLGGVRAVEGHDGREAAGCRVAVEHERSGLRARRALGHDERVDGRLDVLDRR